MRQSERISRIGQSGTMSLFAKVAAMRRAGADIISFSVGEPDDPTPTSAKEAGVAVINENRTGYTINQGLFSLREAIVEKMKDEQGLEYKPEQILVSTGAKQAIFELLYVLCNEGDEVLIISPYYVSYPEQIRLCGGVPVVVETTHDNEYQLDLSDIKSKITDRTIGIVVNTPGNPTGVVYDHRSIEVIAKAALEFDLWVISDEIYEKIVYPPSFHISPAQHSPEMATRTFVVNGFSKGFAMTGWRLGYCAGPQEIIAAATMFQSHTTSNACTVSQHAGEAALKTDRDYGRQIASELLKKHEYAYKALESTPGLKPFKAHGAFYLWIKLELPKASPYAASLALATYLLEEHGVALVPGTAFGCEGYLRLAYALGRSELEEGCKRIKRGLEQLSA